jgi:hypothetical protein
MYRDQCSTLYKLLIEKDISIVSNPRLSHMILLDCEASYFGEHITNGVPLCLYTGDELLHLQDYMMELRQTHDVRECNKTNLNLLAILNIKDISI